MGDKTRPAQMEVTTGTSNNDTVPTLGKVEDMIGVENLWDRVTGATNYLKPYTDPGDTLHLNDEESTSWSTVDLQIFRNGTPDLNLWAATATAGSDANLNLIRSRGTIGTYAAVQDNDLIGNINFIGASSASNFNNGAEIRAEINGAVSAGVLPCDLVFYVNAGAGSASEGMRLDKNKNLIVLGDVGLTGTRITKGWFTDLEITNMPTVSGTSINDNGALSLTSAEITQLGNIDTTTISTTQFDYLGAMDQGVNTAVGVSFLTVTAGNLSMDGNIVSSSSGVLDLIPAAGSSARIDGHWGFDANAMTGLTDNNTIINAYAGKNVTVEDVRLNSGDITMDNGTLSGSRSAGGILKLQSTTDVSIKGIININDGSDFVFTSGVSTGVFKVEADADGTLQLGRSKLFSAVTDIAYWSHFDNDNATDYGIKQLASGRVCVNAKAATQVDICVNNVAQINVDATKTTLTNYLNQDGIFAEIFVADASAAQSIATGATYTKSTAFTTNGQSSNCTSDATNDKITITQIGRYRVSGSCSAIAGKANLIWRGAAFLNGVEQDQVHWKRKMATNTDAGDMSFTGFIDVTSVPWDLDFRLRHSDGDPQNFTIEYANLNVEYIGAT